MKIAYISELVGTRREGGENIAAIYLAKYIEELGNDVTVFSFSNGIETNIPDKIKLLPYIRQIAVFPFVGKKILPIIEREFDIVHITSTTETLFYKPKIPSILTIHSIMSQQIKSISKTYPIRYKIVVNKFSYDLCKYFELKTFKNVDHIVTVKEDTKNFLIDSFDGGFDADKISVVPNGVDTKLFVPSKKKENNVLFVGRGTIAKGIDVLIEARDKIDAKVTVVTNKISQKFVSSGKQKGIQFLFSVPHNDLSAIYKHSKIFVLPSLEEQQPLTVLEAMASGLPVVTTPIGSGDLIVDGKNGFIVPPKNPDKLAEAINTLLEDEKLANDMGKLNREIVEEKYSWEKVALDVFKIYKKLV